MVTIARRNCGFFILKFSNMQQSQTNTSKDVKTGAGNQPENTSKPRQAADDKAKQDADEKLPEEEKNTPEDSSSKEVDELVQGQKLEKKYRGGDATDADEFEQR